jgi:hypothetical protein
VHRLQDLLGIEGLDRDHRPLVGDGVERPEHAAEAVEEGHRDAHPILRPELHALPDVEGVLDDVGVGELHTFREPRRSRGVLHVDHLVRTQRILPLAQLLRRHFLSTLQKFVEAYDGKPFRGIRAHEDDVLQVRQYVYRKLPLRGIGELGDGLPEYLDKIGVLHALREKEGCGV